MIIKARHHWFFYPFFRRYSRWMPEWSFSKVRLHHSVGDRQLPVLMIGNHISWWDGFLAEYINHKVFRRRYHVMMLEEQLQRYPFLKYVGAFSIKKNSRRLIESLNHSVDILRSPENLLVLFPQGEIQTLYTPYFEFEKGLDYILKRAGDTQIIFNVNLVDYFSFRRPELSIYFEEYKSSSDPNFKTIERAFNEFAQRCKDRQGNE